MANSPEFIELLAVPVGNIIAKIPDNESIDKDSDSRRFVSLLKSFHQADEALCRSSGHSSASAYLTFPFAGHFGMGNP